MSGFALPHCPCHSAASRKLECSGQGCIRRCNRPGRGVVDARIPRLGPGSVRADACGRKRGLHPRLDPHPLCLLRLPFPVVSAWRSQPSFSDLAWTRSGTGGAWRLLRGRRDAARYGVDRAGGSFLRYRMQAFRRGAANADSKAVLAATIIDLLIAACPVADDIGVWLSARRSVIWAGCSCWNCWSFYSCFTAVAAAHISSTGVFFGIGVVGGLFAVTAYGLVIYAKTIAPLGAVSPGARQASSLRRSTAWWSSAKGHGRYAFYRRW